MLSATTTNKLQSKASFSKNNPVVLMGFALRYTSLGVIIIHFYFPLCYDIDLPLILARAETLNAFCKRVCLTEDQLINISIQEVYNKQHYIS